MSLDPGIISIFLLYLFIYLEQNCFYSDCVSAFSVVSDTLWPHGWQPARIPCLWGSPGKKTGLGCHAFLQAIFLTQEAEFPGLHIVGPHSFAHRFSLKACVLRLLVVSREPVSLASPALQVDSSPTEPPGKPFCFTSSEIVGQSQSCFQATGCASLPRCQIRSVIVSMALPCSVEQKNRNGRAEEPFTGSFSSWESGLQFSAILPGFIFVNVFVNSAPPPPTRLWSIG